MDREFRDFKRSAKLEPSVQKQAEIARSHWRAGRLLEAYDIYKSHSLLELEHPEAVALAKEMADLQKPHLERLRSSWNLYRCFPGWARLTESVQIHSSDFSNPIDTLCLDWPTTKSERKKLAATPFIRGLKIIRENLPIDWTDFEQSLNLENLWIFFQNTDDALKGLEGLKSLRRVKLFCDSLQLENIDNLQRMPSIEELEIYQNGRPVEQLRGLKQLVNLTQFTLCLKEFNSKRLDQILILENLTQLKVPNCELNTNQLSRIKALPKIEVIEWGEGQVFRKVETA